MASLRAAQKAMTRQRLLDTALEVFVDRGYSSTTIDDIATAAGTTRVTFYAHFPSRKDIMVALVHELNETLDRVESTERGSRAIALVDAVEAGTADAIEPWIRAQVERWPQIKPFILAATEAAAVDPDVREVFEGWFREVGTDIVEGLTRADRFDPESRAARGDLAMAQLDHTAIGWMRHGGKLQESPQVTVLIESWVKLLGSG